MTYALLYEKEKKLREGMKMMGLNNTSFYLSWIITYFIIYTLISIIATILICKTKYLTFFKANFIFKHTNGFVIFLNYWLFCIVLISQSLFLSVFFTRSLFGLIVSIVWYLLMYMVISLVSTDSNVPKATLWGASISSHAAFSFSFDVMAIFDG
jgi:ATP-binding cassette subfamily A (ABC1) protein 3